MGNAIEKTGINRTESKLKDKKNEELYKSYGGDLKKMLNSLGVDTESENWGNYVSNIFRKNKNPDIAKNANNNKKLSDVKFGNYVSNVFRKNKNLDIVKNTNNNNELNNGNLNANKPFGSNNLNNNVASINTEAIKNDGKKLINLIKEIKKTLKNYKNDNIVASIDTQAIKNEGKKLLNLIGEIKKTLKYSKNDNNEITSDEIEQYINSLIESNNSSNSNSLVKGGYHGSNDWKKKNKIDYWIEGVDNGSLKGVKEPEDGSYNNIWNFYDNETENYEEDPNNLLQ